MAKQKKAYRVYVKDAAEWTLEDESSYDYVLLDGTQIFFISQDELEDGQEAEYVPPKVASWLAECEAQLVRIKHEKRIKRAAKQLEKDFKANLDKLLDMQNNENTEEG